MGVHRVGRGDGCLLTDGGAGLDRGEARLRLIKLTKPSGAATPESARPW